MQNDKPIELWINTIQVKGRGLTEWEENFVESVSRQFDKKGTLSDKQIEILERIYAERTPL